MSSVELEDRVKNLLGQMDRKDHVKQESESRVLQSQIDFMARFSIVKEREIVPALNRFFEIDNSSFRVDSSKIDEVSITITRGVRRKTITFTPFPEREQIEVSSYPPYHRFPGYLSLTLKRDDVERLIEDQLIRMSQF